MSARNLIIFILIAAIYSNLCQYLWEANYISILPRTWYGIFCILAIASYIFSLSQNNSENRSEAARAHKNNKTKLLAWTTIYVIDAFLAWSYSDVTDFGFALHGTLVTALIFVASIILMTDHQAVRTAQAALATVVIICAITNTIEIFTHGTFFRTINIALEQGRASGFYSNPNTSAIFIGLGMIVGSYGIPQRLRIPFCLVAALGIILTFSRAGMLIWITGFIGLSIAGCFRVNRLLLAFGLALLVAGFIAMQFFGALDNLVQSANLGEGAKSRLQYDSNDASVQGRLQVAQRSLELIAESPIFGHGLGAARHGQTTVYSHNQLLYTGVEQGLIGMSILLSLFYLILRLKAPPGPTFAIAFGIAFATNHNLMQYQGMLIPLAIMAGFVFKECPARQSTVNREWKDTTSQTQAGYRASTKNSMLEPPIPRQKGKRSSNKPVVGWAPIFPWL